MWKLKLSESKEKEWVRSVNNHVGRQFWEFDPHLGTEEERAQVDQFRQEFNNNRFKAKQSSDLLMRLQVLIYNFSITYTHTPKHMLFSSV